MAGGPHRAARGLAGFTIKRVGEYIDVYRRGGGTLTVPEGETFTVEAGETVRVEDTEVNGELVVDGTLIVETEANVENKYGHLDDNNAGFVHIGKHVAHKMYTEGNQIPDIERMSGGAQPTNQPIIAVPHDSIVEAEDRMTFSNDEEFKLETRFEQPTHIQFQANNVSS